MDFSNIQDYKLEKIFENEFEIHYKLFIVPKTPLKYINIDIQINNEK